MHHRGQRWDIFPWTNNGRYGIRFDFLERGFGDGAPSAVPLAGLLFPFAF